jgi:hypothetical protein
MCYAYFLEKGIKFLVLATPICLHAKDFMIEETLNVSLKLQEDAENIRSTFKTINPCKLAEIINKAYIKLKTTRRGARRPPNIGVHELKRSMRNTR